MRRVIFIVGDKKIINFVDIFHNTREWLIENGYGKITNQLILKKSKTNEIIKIETEKSFDFVLKANTANNSNSIKSEVVSLKALKVKGGPKIPKIFHWGECYYLMEYISSSNESGGNQEVFANELASLHKNVSPSFGFYIDNNIGESIQINSQMKNGFEFFGEHRLRIQGEMAVNSGLLSVKYQNKLDKLIFQLPNLIPDQPASLIHGDLWMGNILFNEMGEGVLIDPATHFGWAEAELAMTIMFGNLSDHFFLEYQNVSPEVKGWQERADLYNLYHFLNHLNIFGFSYLSSVKRILNRFG